MYSLGYAALKGNPYVVSCDVDFTDKKKEDPFLEELMNLILDDD